VKIREMIETTRALRPALSYSCDANCEACYASGMKNGRMDLSFFKKLLDEGKELGFNAVAFDGGEPLQELDLLKQCLKEAKEREYDTAITTNGKLLTMDLIRDLERAGLDFFQLSIGFNRVSITEKLYLLRDSNASFSVNFLVDRSYLDMIPIIHKGLERLNVQYVTYVIPKVMRPRLEYLKFSLNDLIKYFKILKSMKEDSSLPFLVDCATHAIEKNMECTGTSRGVTVSPFGKISFCAFCGKWVDATDSFPDAVSRLDSICSGKCTCLDKVIDPSGI